MEHKEYKYLDIFRVILCITVLLYHLSIIKGGFLAVCSFFVLSGYLSTLSALKKEKFSILDYYKKRIIRIYIPVLLVLFTTIGVISLLPSITWLNIKTETLSILGCYNNFWQLSVNADYFAGAGNSPFTHFWYIAILIQFDLVFPFIYLLLKKMGDKIHKSMPIIISLLLTVASIIYFIILNNSGNIMGAYFNTFSRVHALFLGVAVAFIHYYFNQLVFTTKNHIFERIIIILYLILMISGFIVLSSDIKLYGLSMIVMSILSARFISYATTIENNKLNIVDKLNKKLASISYEIYLLQYPLIYIFFSYDLPYALKLFLIITILLISSIILHYALNYKKEQKAFTKITKALLLILISAFSIWGAIRYTKYEDHSEEMEKLEEQLAINEELMLQKQKEYEEKVLIQEEELNNSLDDITKKIEDIDNVIKKLSVTGIGDSVMLGAISNLYDMFPNSYFDAKISRTCWVVNDIVSKLKSSKQLGKVVILNFGANGDCPERVKNQIMKTLSDREVFWLTVTNDAQVHFNDKIKKYAKNYSNLHIIDWNKISNGHDEYFVADGIHLKPAGRKAYVQAIYDAIYDTYLKKYEQEKQQIINEHLEKQREGIEFFGNELLLGLYNYIETDFEGSKFNMNKDYDYETLKKDLNENQESLKNTLIFVFDDNFKISSDNYNKLFKNLKNKTIYIITNNKDLKKELKSSNIHLIDISKFTEDDYLSDNIHLSEQGNKKLKDEIIKIISEQ